MTPLVRLSNWISSSKLRGSERVAQSQARFALLCGSQHDNLNVFTNIQGGKDLRHNPDEIPDINLNPGAGGVFGGGEDLTADFFRDVGFATIGAHFCRHRLEDKGRGIPLEGDDGATGTGLPHFTDDALHIVLLLKS
jgi:hypothetical protein